MDACTIRTTRLLLRPFTLDDAPEVQRLAGDRDVACTTASIPHPYLDGMAEAWIESHKAAREEGQALVMAIINLSNGLLMGAVGLTISKDNNSAELGYWVGKPYWNKSYCTEAALAMAKHAFQILLLNRLHACHMASNPASGRVLQKIGMIYEGCRRKHHRRWDEFHDIELYGMLREDYLRSSRH